jgi:hypothetical protein
MNYVNRLMTLNEEVVAKHASNILKELGLDKDNDGILDRIVVSSKIGDSIPNAHFIYDCRQNGFMGMRGSSYVPYSGKIELFPGMQMNMNIGKRLIGVPARGLLTHLFNKRIERTLIFLLAHELRHYWQYYTGTINTKMGGIRTAQLMPYEHRWEEIDANEFASQYMESISK